jgi:hypothetical protein
MPSVRTVVRTLIVVLLIAAPVLVGGAASAGVQAGDNPSISGTDRTASHALTVSIDSVSPNWAQPGKRITVQGTVSNHTASAVGGLHVGLQTSSTAFGSRSAMESYASGGAGSGYFSGDRVGAPDTLPRVHPDSTLHWSVSFPASDAGYTQFGVYPLQAVAFGASQFNPFATSRTLLPYWPDSSAADPVRVSWIWPLIDQPRRGPCSQTLSASAAGAGGLASSLEPSGRLGGLLSTGLKWAGQADLTWAVDPALLSDAKTMTSPYKTGGNAECTGTTAQPASSAASQWLSTLTTEAAGQPMFVTPYADADVSALTRSGMTDELRTAYTLGEQVAGRILQRPFGKTGTGDGGAPSVAWSAGGAVDEGLLTSLASAGGVSTTLLGSAALPGSTALPASTGLSGSTSESSTGPTVSTDTTGIGTPMRIVRADSGLSNLLGTSSAGSSAGGQFATEQDFLAESAMIVAELPFGQNRSIVVAPPRRWDPSAAEAGALLSDTVNAPWLRPTKLSSVVSSPAGPAQVPGSAANKAALSGSYMKRVQSAGSSLGLYQGMLYRPSSSLTRSLAEALVSTTSTAWRGSGRHAGSAQLTWLSDFVRDSEREVQIIASKKWLMAGSSGSVGVSVRNASSQSVQVRVQADLPATGQISVGKFDALVTVPAGKTTTVKMPLRATGIETTTLRLQLVTRNGSPLAWTSQPLTVQITRYGQALIILIFGALGVVVLASVARWVRKWLSDTKAGSGGTG